MPILPRAASVLFVLLPAAACAAPPALMELEVGAEAVRGKIVAMDDATCWLLRRDGSLDEWNVNAIRKARRVEARFRPLSALEVRDQVRRELGAGFDVVATRRYVVAAAPGSASKYAQLFDEVFGAFDRYFSVRGFRVGEPEFPLVAIVFPDHAGFAAYCQKDGIRAARGLMGYYHRRTNRVALFDPGKLALAPPVNVEEAALPPPLTKGGPGGVRGTGDPRSTQTPPSPPFARGGTEQGLLASVEKTEVAFGSIQADLRDTIIHEGVHQAAFNTGLHSRAGRDPVWVIEGLAMVFESPGVRDAAANTSAAGRINAERYVHFGNFARERRTAKSLAEFVGGDESFRTATLDAYSQAWALSFYLIDTRPADYARYLKTIARRDPLQPYGPKERVEDFKKVFGRDLDVLEANFLRYIEGVQKK